MEELYKRIDAVCNYEVDYYVDEGNETISVLGDNFLITIFPSLYTKTDNDRYFFRLVAHKDNPGKPSLLYDSYYTSEEIVNLCRTQSIDCLLKPYHLAESELDRLLRSFNLTF